MKKEKSELETLIEWYKYLLASLDDNIKMFKREKDKELKKFDKELRKYWKKLMRQKDINDVDAEWEWIVVDL